MFKILLISKDTKTGRTIAGDLTAHNFACDHISPDETVDEAIIDKAPDLVILALENPTAASPIIEIIRELRRERPIPIIALVPKDALGKSRDIPFVVDDFVIEPYETEEIALRVEKALKETYAVESKDLIRNDELMIDLTRREVTLDGKTLSLTFTEYELLIFLAANSGRVFTREALLNKIWGYDYYGGDRTVDVHIRRLRAKIEWGKHPFIETVRGAGYRFKEPSD
ncbi:MAG: response regulator transcription factor [Deltaproteobacteria bacterium]|nr:response regulator transcription factor [Deltaproteobacteria bacterium]